MFDLEGGAKLIDTPGIKGFGLVDIRKEELSGYFVEFSTLDKECKFNNCMHINEPQCAVKAASERERLPIVDTSHIYNCWRMIFYTDDL